MTREESLAKLLKAYSGYYDINTEDPITPFVAEAVFHLHDEQYFLVRSATLSEVDSGELVFFASVPRLDETVLQELDQAAWEAGLGKVRPHKDHRNTDVILYILAEEITDGVKKMIPKMKHYQSYRFGFHGFSHYRLLAYDVSSNTLIRNRMGEPLENVIRNTFMHLS